MLDEVESPCDSSTEMRKKKPWLEKTKRIRRKKKPAAKEAEANEKEEAPLMVSKKGGTEAEKLSHH